MASVFGCLETGLSPSLTSVFPGLSYSCPCPFLASYSSHLPMSLCFNSCAQVSLLFPHLSVSFQRFLLSFVLVSCTLGLPAHCSAILTFLPSSPSIPTLSPVSTQFTGVVQHFSPQTLVLPPFAACGVPSVSIPLSSLGPPAPLILGLNVSPDSLSSITIVLSFSMPQAIHS